VAAELAICYSSLRLFARGRNSLDASEFPARVANAIYLQAQWRFFTEAEQTTNIVYAWMTMRLFLLAFAFVPSLYFLPLVARNSLSRYRCVLSSKVSVLSSFLFIGK